MRGIFILGLSSIFLAGCATRSSDIAEAYVSPIQYQSYSCTQLREEAARVSTHAMIAICTGSSTKACSRYPMITSYR
jgi:hypothetical protein